MLEKRELTQEELENVASGASSLASINWLFSKDAEVQVILEDNTRVSGKVTKRGYVVLGYTFDEYLDYYYIENETNPYINRWYDGGFFNNKTISITKATGAVPTEYPW